VLYIVWLAIVGSIQWAMQISWILAVTHTWLDSLISRRHVTDSLHYTTLLDMSRSSWHTRPIDRSQSIFVFSSSHRILEMAAMALGESNSPCSHALFDDFTWSTYQEQGSKHECRCAEDDVSTLQQNTECDLIYIARRRMRRRRLANVARGQ